LTQFGLLPSTWQLGEVGDVGLVALVAEVALVGEVELVGEVRQETQPGALVEYI